MFKKTTARDKRGAMLILVLLIVALAVILIGSALSMTRQTRTRYYSYAEGSQSRLTATSIAESLWDAIYIQEIDDATVEEMANGEAVLNLSGISVPGANDVSNGTVTFHQPESDGKIKIDCSATVGGSTSNVRLTIVPPEPTTITNLFEHLVNLAGGSNITETNIGAGGTGATDNTILIQGNGVDINGSCDIYSDTFIQGVFVQQDNRFHGDVIFWGPNAQMKLSSSINAKLGGNNLYFVSPSESDMQNSVSAESGATLDDNGVIGEFGLYNANFAMTVGNGFDHSDFISGIGVSGGGTYADSTHKTALESATTKAEIVSKAKAYAEKGFSDHYPTIDEVADSFGCDTNPSGPVVISGDYGPGSYKINGNVSGNLNFDISGGDCTVYVTSDCIVTGSISFINGAGSPYWGRIILSSGINFTISGAGAGVYSYENGKPHCFIYGMGCVKFDVVDNGPSSIEAYVGLYDSASTSADDASRFHVEGSPDKFDFKGRLSVPLYEHINGGHLNIPYCVDPTHEGGDGKIYPIVTGYKVEPFVYFN